MEYLFKIGEVAELFEITVRALRLYDKMGLFRPEYVDSNTGYRYYTEPQMNKLNTIVSLRKVGFSIKDVSSMFDPKLSYEQLMRILELKKASIQKHIDTLQFNNEMIDNMMKTAQLTHKASYIETLTDEEYEFVLSKVACLENIKFENLMMQIMWL